MFSKIIGFEIWAFTVLALATGLVNHLPVAINVAAGVTWLLIVLAALRAASIAALTALLSVGAGDNQAAAYEVLTKMFATTRRRGRASKIIGATKLAVTLGLLSAAGWIFTAAVLLIVSLAWRTINAVAISKLDEIDKSTVDRAAADIAEAIKTKPGETRKPGAMNDPLVVKSSMKMTSERRTSSSSCD